MQTSSLTSSCPSFLDKFRHQQVCFGALRCVSLTIALAWNRRTYGCYTTNQSKTPNLSEFVEFSVTSSTPYWWQNDLQQAVTIADP